MSGNNKGRISKENEGEKGDLFCTLKPSFVICVVMCLSFDGCLVIFWPNVMMYKSCPPLILTHTNEGTAVVEAAVSWEIAHFMSVMQLFRHPSGRQQCDVWAGFSTVFRCRRIQINTCGD